MNRPYGKAYQRRFMYFDVGEEHQHRRRWERGDHISEAIGLCLHKPKLITVGGTPTDRKSLLLFDVSVEHTTSAKMGGKTNKGGKLFIINTFRVALQSFLIAFNKCFHINSLVIY